MPPKRNNPPLDPVTLCREFGEAGPEALAILGEEAAKLIDWHLQAQDELKTSKVISQKLRLCMTSAVQALTLPFQVRRLLLNFLCLLLNLSILLHYLALGAQRSRSTSGGSWIHPARSEGRCRASDPQDLVPGASTRFRIRQPYPRAQR